MLGNTLVVTIGGVAKTLTLVDYPGSYAAEYKLTETLVQYRAFVRHGTAKGDNGSQDRHNVELIRITFATATLPKYTERVYFVMQTDPGRDAVDLAAAIFAWGTASTNANLVKVQGGES